MVDSRLWLLLGLALVVICVGILLTAVPNYAEKISLKEKATWLIPNQKSFGNIRTFSTANKIYLAILVIVTIGLAIRLHLAFSDFYILALMKRLATLSFLFPAAYWDVKEKIIPNLTVISGFAIYLCFLLAEVLTLPAFVWPILLNSLIAAGIMLVAMILARLVSRGGLGFGDMKLLLVLALFQGTTGILQTVFSSLLVSFFAAIFLLVSKKKQKNDSIPFAPFILCGAVISIALTGV